MKEEEVRGIVKEYREVKSLNLRFHTNNIRNEALICLPTEKEAQLAITDISTYKEQKVELYSPIRISKEFERETRNLDNSDKELEPTINNESSTKQ